MNHKIISDKKVATVLIPAGSFTMGHPEIGFRDQFVSAFALFKEPVSYRLWKSIMQKGDPPLFHKHEARMIKYFKSLDRSYFSEDRIISHVSWSESVRFCQLFTVNSRYNESNIPKQKRKEISSMDPRKYIQEVFQGFLAAYSGVAHLPSETQWEKVLRGDLGLNVENGFFTTGSVWCSDYFTKCTVSFAHYDHIYLDRSSTRIMRANLGLEKEAIVNGFRFPRDPRLITHDLGFWPAVTVVQNKPE